jgi:imidazolonepropionase
VAGLGPDATPPTAQATGQTRPRADLLVVNAGELLTCAAGAADRIGRIANGSVAIAGEHIIAVGDASAVNAAVDSSGAHVIDAGGQVVLPGFVDCHTHIVFGGSRVEEYAVRAAGGDVAQLRERGVPVGIVGTMTETRELSLDELVAQSASRVTEMLAAGTTTIESKSGYGLETAVELRLLHANRRLGEQSPVDVVSTFMGAHAVPAGMAREKYVRLVIAEMLPAVAEAGLAEFCDVFCEAGYFTVADTAAILEAGLALGMRPKLHLDQYRHSGAAALAAELPCVSVDHLNFTTGEEIARLADAGVTGVVMPGIDFATAHPKPVDCRVLLERGMTVALATDICPGGWLPSMQLVIVFACRLHHLPVAEAIRAATLGAAQALGRQEEIGSLEPGKLADLLLLDIARHEDLAYRMGRNAVEIVIKRGAVGFERQCP